jgi:hypothetical protein
MRDSGEQPQADPESENIRRLFDEFRYRLEINQRYYREDDPANISLSAFAEAALHELEEPYFREMVEDTLSARVNEKPSTIVKLFERAYQADLLQHEQDYPNPSYRSPEAWIEEFKAVDEDMTRWGVVWHTLRHRNLQSNIAERYKPVKVITALLSDRFESPPNHLDVGSSIMNGSIKLAFNRPDNPGEVPFGQIDIMAPESRYSSYERKDYYATRLANRALREHVEYGTMIGTDITDVNDPVTDLWAQSCSFYPDELMDERKVQEYMQLKHLDPHHERVLAFRGDFTNSHHVRKLRDFSPVEAFDIITFSTIFYQLKNKQEQLDMLIHASQLLSERGVIIIQDGIDGDFSKKYNYVTWLRDGMAADSTSDQELFRWETPRCQKAVLGVGKFAMGDKLQTISEAFSSRYDT